MRIDRIASRIAAFAVLSLMLGMQEQVGAAPIQWGGNGNYYDMPEVQYTSWSDAKSTAEASTFLGMTGHLATVSSSAENDFIYNTFKTGASGAVHSAWIGLTDNEAYGGLESGNPTNNGAPFWVWVTGEPLTFTNWISGEPNNLQSEDYVELVFTETLGLVGGWNDLAESYNDGKIRYSIIEYEAVPEPNSFFLTAIGGCLLLIPCYLEEAANLYIVDAEKASYSTAERRSVAREAAERAGAPSSNPDKRKPAGACAG